MHGKTPDIGAANAFNFKEIKHLKGAITWGVARGGDSNKKRL